MCSTAFGGLARAQAKALGAPDQPLLIIEHPFGSRSREEVAALAATLVERIAETVRLAAAAGAARAGADTGAAPAAGAADGRLIELPADIEAFHQACSDRRWSDGLPVIPPTPARVARMLSGSSRAPTAVVATLAPGFGAATVELIAVNAVMAGCLPAHLPVLIAAVEAAADPAFNLQAVQSTTNPVTTWLIVNGPIALALGMNAGINCLGQGNLPNATLGRALRLVMQNIGGAWPAEMDRATHGQPGKFLFCCAENEAASPWAPLHADRGFAAGDNAVTVVAASGTLNLNTHSKDADELLACLARSMAYPASNDYHYCGEPWMILSPEHASVMAGHGYDKAAVRRMLWEQSMMTAGQFAKRDYERTRNARLGELPGFDGSTPVPLSRSPQDIGIVVAGGPGTHSVYVPTFGETRAVTRRIEA
ncbi:MAG: hypothetical protein ACK5T2_11125 [bacterium]